MLKLYQVEWCPYCHRVRQVMTELGLTYECVNVQADRDEREELAAVSGQEGVPVLVDGDRVIADSGEIIEHLRALGEPPPDAGEHAARGRFRLVTKLDLAPARALDRLRAVLDRAGIPVVAEIPGEALAPDRLPAGYTLVHAAVPAAAAKVVQSDPTIPSAVTIPMAVFAVEGGSEIAVTRPLAGAWLYCNPEACSITYALTERVVQAVKEL